MLALLAVSLLLQVAAAVLAFRLTRLVGPRYGWVLLGTALGLMAIRRGVTFYRLVSGDDTTTPDLAAEVIALVISGFCVVGLAGIAPFFHDMQRASDAVRLNEGRLRVALDSGEMTTWEWDVTTDNVVWDERVSTVLGVPADAPPASSTEYYKLVLPQDLPGLQRAAQKSADDLTNIDVEFRITRPDNGQVRWIAGKGKFLRDVGGHPTRMIGVNYDITRTKEAQELLRAGDERFRLLVDAIKDYAIHMLDTRGRVSSWNEGAHRLWGYTADEIVGSDFSVFYTPEDLAARMPDRSLRIAESKGRFASEGWRVRKDGSRFWAEVLITPMRSTTGSITGYARVTRDLTEKKMVEDSLRETQARLLAAQDIARMGTWSWDLREDHVEVSDNWLNILRLPLDSRRMALDRWMELIHPEDRDYVLEAGQRGIAAGTPYYVKFRMTRGDGSVCHVNAWGRPHVDAGHRVTRVSGVSQDITDQILNQHAAEESRQRLAGIIDSAMDGIVSLDENYRIILFNEAAERMFQCAAADAIGDGLERFLPVRRRADHRTHIESFARTGEASLRMYATVGLRADGEEFPLEASVSQVEVDGKKAFTLILRDISDRKKTEDALKERERAMSTLLASLPGMAYRCRNDPDWTFEFVSEGTRLVSGHAPESFVGGGLTWATLIHPDDRDAVWREVQDALRDRRPFELTYRIRAADGAERIVWERGVGVFGNRDEVIALEGFITDITRRKQAESALGEAKTRYESLVQSIEGIVWEADPSTFQFTFVSDWATTLTGFAPSDWTASPTFWRDHLHPDDREQAVRVCKESTLAGRNHTLEYRMLSADGKPVWLRDIISVESESGKPTRMRGVIIDITQRKRIEEALKESEARYRSLIEASTAIVWTANAEGAFVAPQESWQRYTGQTWNEHQGWSWLDAIHPEDREHVQQLWQRAVAGRKLFEVQGRIWRKSDETWRWFQARGVPIFHREDEVAEWVGTFTDIDEQRRAAELLQRTNEELERRVQRRTAELELANRELESFSYSVSHDLRAPLRGIDGFTLAILEDYAPQLPAEAQQMFARVREGAQRMGRLIDDLLDLSRLSRSRMRRTDVDLSAMAESILQNLHTSDRGRAVEIFIQPEMLVRADEALLRVALENLLSNAWKFTVKTAAARIEIGTMPGEDGFPVYFVRDNGAGFDNAYADRLFGPFQRLHSTSEFPGNGIGLATVARVLHRHGGRAWADGAPGKGATFYFSLGPEGAVTHVRPRHPAC